MAYTLPKYALLLLIIVLIVAVASSQKPTQKETSFFELQPEAILLSISFDGWTRSNLTAGSKNCEEISLPDGRFAYCDTPGLKESSYVIWSKVPPEEGFFRKVISAEIFEFEDKSYVNTFNLTESFRIAPALISQTESGKLRIDKYGATLFSSENHPDNTTEPQKDSEELKSETLYFDLVQGETKAIVLTYYEQYEAEVQQIVEQLAR
ncbi:MAG: hypothetical protein JW727_00810 [Candidatus Aenigmarchaeota archaeon]|nr:hypothetical protein [Candidatus Aenigmarchaeota archaeon]